MKLTANLQTMVIISFSLHVVLLGVTSVVFKKRHTIYIPSSVKVDIIAPKVNRRPQSSSAEEKKAGTVKSSVVKETPKKETTRPLISTEEIKMLENRISDIESRRKTKELEEMIEERIGRISEKADDAGSGNNAGPASSGSYYGKGDPYLDLLYTQIKSVWVYTGRVEKDMEAIIEINIDSSGNIRVLGIEKSSGNAQFDRSVIRAIKKASPVQKPPRKIGTIGFIFYP